MKKVAVVVCNNGLGHIKRVLRLLRLFYEKFPSKIQTDIFAEIDPLMDPAAANRYVMDYFNKAKSKKGEKNLTEATAYLADNGGKEGVQTTESGLQYKILTEGSGPIPVATDMVKVNYRGTLIDGQEFDASSPENPAQFRVNGVIKGWTEALEMMPVG